MFFVAALTAIVSLLRRRVPLLVPSPAGFAIAASLIYFAVDAASPLVYANPNGSWSSLIGSLHFLFFPLVLLAAASARFDAIAAFVAGARFGALAAGAVAVLQVWDGVDRAFGGMINSIPFGTTSALFASVSLIGIGDNGWRSRIFGGAAFTAGMIACALSESRGAWIALPALAIIILVYFKARYGGRVALAATGSLAALAVVAALAAGSSIKERLDETFAMFGAFEFGQRNADAVSLDQRAMMWAYGLEAIADRPVFGYGPQNAVAEVRARAAEDDNEILQFRHLHSEFLTETVGNGIVGLVTLLLLLSAPVVTAVRSRRDGRFHDRVALATLTTVGVSLFALTGLAFGHDLTNDVFVGALLAVCLSAAGSGPRSVAEQHAPTG